MRERLREVALPLLLMAASAVVIGLVRPKLFFAVTKIRDTSEAYPLPPPEQLPTLSMGYRSALADLIWAHVLVTQGLRIQQRRRFEFAERYFTSIFDLEPGYRSPYLLVDTILTFGIKKARPEDVYAARALLERGMRERPEDALLHLQAGSFMAYLAPGILPEEEHKAWRIAGAQAMIRAGELGASDGMVQWHSLAGASVLNRQGERATAVAFLERAYAVTDDVELRGEIARQLRGLRAEDAAERAQSSMSRFETAWRDELPFASRTLILLLGPRADEGACAGPGHSERPNCQRDWRSWTAKSGE